MSEFWKRTIFGAIYVAAVVGSILWCAEVFLVLSSVLAVLAVREYNRLTHPFYWADVCGGVCAALLCVIAYSVEHWSTISYDAGYVSIVVACAAGLYLGMMAAAVIGELWHPEGHPMADWGNLFIGQIMIALPFALMNGLCGMGKYLLLAIFILIWVNDTGAYCVGSLTAKRKNGNHKMFVRVSPKKSWEGLFGGLALAVGVGALLASFGWFDGLNIYINRYVIGMLFALIVGVFGTLGDLIESLIKRSVGVKDSGKFLPGHGGVLDRFDSVLLAAPAAMLFLILISNM